ncbi:dolichyl-phosphate-mannose-protein mannosyltransferase [Leptospira johnsonii]|uniref:Dolichyl-phosphate-mannose-protein mannosyltransferase n=1 Tax=Leptospira johnsonii TaxID=1917820 RepID=A0A2P2D404_9LEPT|nr:dolichyl-phosphate-mannose-protein mannosyltransferase [Leptospira johnsonii]
MVNFLFFLGIILNTYFISVILHKKGLPQPLSRNLVSFTLSILIIGSIALLLVSFESYKILSVVLIQLLVSGSFIGYIFFRKIDLRLSPISGWNGSGNLFTNAILSLLLLSAGAMYSLFPIEYIKGDRDHGVYVVFGSKIQKTGGLNFDDFRYQELTQVLGNNIIYGYPAIHSDHSPQDPSVPIGSLSPRFYPLFPTFLALSADLFGLDAMFRVNSIFGVLSLVFIFLIVKKWIGPWGALIAVFFCAFNPAQLWNVRTTLSEPLGQLLILFSSYLALYFFRKNKGWMFFAGGILGLSSFNRIDSLIYFPAIVIFVGYLLFLRKKSLWRGFNFLFGYSAISILGVLYGYINSKPYMVDLWKSKQLLKLTFFCVSSSILLSGLLFFSNLKIGKKSIELLKNTILKNKKILRVAILSFLFLLITFAYAIQPVISNSENLTDFFYFKKNSFIFFVLYVPLLLVLFGIGGYDLLVFRKQSSGSLVFLLLGSLLSFVYFYDPSIYPDHYWASRRWVLFPIPFACIMGVLGLYSLPIKRQAIKSALIALIFAGYIYHLYNRNRLIFFERMLSGYSEEFERLSVSLPSEKAIYFTKKQDLASPLRYLSGRDTYLIHKTRPFLENASRLIESGWNVYLIDEDFNLEDGPITLEKVDKIHLEGNYPLDTVNRYPDMLLYRGTFLQVYKLGLDPKASAQVKKSVSLNPSQFAYMLKTVRSERKSQPNVYEEVKAYDYYIPKDPKGKFRAEFEGEVLSQATFSVTANQSSSVIFPESPGVGDDKKMSIEFSVENPETDDVQIRFHTKKDRQAVLKSLQLSRIP